MTTPDLVSRLLEAITAKEEKAEAAKTLHVSLNLARRGGKTTLYDFLNDNDPSSVLRRCAADRAVLAIHSPTEDFEPDSTGEYVPVPGAFNCVTCSSQAYDESWPCPTIRAVASGHGLEGTE